MPFSMLPFSMLPFSIFRIHFWANFPAARSFSRKGGQTAPRCKTQTARLGCLHPITGWPSACSPGLPNCSLSHQVQASNNHLLLAHASRPYQYIDAGDGRPAHVLHVGGREEPDQDMMKATSGQPDEQPGEQPDAPKLQGDLRIKRSQVFFCHA